jgi:hypothetical protein
MREAKARVTARTCLKMAVHMYVWLQLWHYEMLHVEHCGNVLKSYRASSRAISRAKRGFVGNSSRRDDNNARACGLSWSRT